MTTALTIAGAVLEIIGLALVFAELAVIRSREFGVPTPWARVETWVRKLINRPKVVSVSASVTAGWATTAGRATVRAGVLEPDATDTERIERLERLVDQIDEDLNGAYNEVKRASKELTAAIDKQAAKLREENVQRDAERRSQLRSSVQRQGMGAAFVLLGLILGTLGNVL